MTQENGKALARGKAPTGTAATRPLVSIVVTARNYARYLGECLKSCLSQTVNSRCEVIYSDDASDDESVAVARSFGEAVRVIAHPAHTGVVASRNRAVQASRGKVLIHVDGDDALPNRFVADHLAVLTGETPFVYGPAQCFGNLNTFWEVPPWRERSLWEQNYCNTSCAIWRWAFDAAGGWLASGMGVCSPDWSLFLRAARFGTPAPSRATLLYRHHGENWSKIEEAKTLPPDEAYQFKDTRQAIARLSIGCIWSGRLPELADTWGLRLATEARNSTLAGKPDLVILDNSIDQSGAELIRFLEGEAGQFEAFRSIVVIPYPRKLEWSTEKERRDAVAGFLAEGYTRLLAETTGDVVLFVEDDVVLPAGGLARLEAELTTGLPLKAAVSGVYENRRRTGKGFVNGLFRDGQIHRIDVGGTPSDVDVAGLGCLLFWRDLCPPQIAPNFMGTPAPDWEFTGRIRQAGRRIVVIPDVECTRTHCPPEPVEAAIDPAAKPARIRVGFIYPDLAMGGAERWLASLLSFSLDERIAWQGVALVGKKKSDSATLRSITDQVPLMQVVGLAGNCDCIVAWGPNCLSALPANFPGPVVLVSHGCGDWSSDMLKPNIPLATHFAAVSSPAAEPFGSALDVTIILNGADVSRCQPSQPREMTRKAMGLGEHEKAVGYVGRFSPEKNPLAAAMAVAELGRPFRAVYAGGGWREGAVKNAVNEILPDAIFLPRVDDSVGDVLNALDCFVLASPSEGMSLAIVEAWLAGTPVVATRVGAIPELEREHGKLVTPVQVEPSRKQLAEAVRDSLAPHNREVVERSRRIANRHYTAETMGQRWCDYLVEITTSMRLKTEPELI